MSVSNIKRIAELNDQLRSRLQVPVFGETVQGTFLMTRGISSLEPEVIINICAAIRNFDAFDLSNDPYAEHDFGGIIVEGTGKVFWKIDYYADENCDAGCEDPSDIATSFRVLTIMLAEEY